MASGKKIFNLAVMEQSWPAGFHRNRKREYLTSSVYSKQLYNESEP